ncbi:MAG: carboxypeptidase regulatory-like domain-containing protein, partial [Desulfococcaceae bacterium]|jgi:hypothetical protein|nr:carboxypeptidase regulatory-like domain-containing protein [Desulfococcaceae bacterium]
VYHAEISGDGCGISGLDIFRPSAVFPGYIKGKITDAQGNPLTGVKITINGVLSFFSLPGGLYRIPWEAGSGISLTAEGSGYDPLSPVSVTVSEGGTVLQNFTLRKTPVITDSQPSAYIVSPADGTVIEAGESLIFQGSLFSGDYPLYYSWDFGNGQKSYLLNPGEISFPEPGVYTVFFRVSDADGDVSAASLTVTVNEKEEPLPPADPDGNSGEEPSEPPDSGENPPENPDDSPAEPSDSGDNPPENPDDSSPDPDGNSGEEPPEPGNGDDGSPGTPEPPGPAALCVKTAAETEICVHTSGEGTGITLLESLYPFTVFPSETGVAEMPEGYITVRLRGGGDSPEISVHYSAPLPADAQWYRYDSANDKWQDETENVTFSADRKAVNIRISDGNPETDGTEKRETAYTAGYRSRRPLTPPSAPPSDDVGGGGCFIGTPAF